MLKEKIGETNQQIQEKLQEVKTGYIDRKKEKEREKERERRKKGQRKFGQSKLKHSTMGLQSCFYAIISFVLLFLCIAISYAGGGKAGGYIGGLGIIAFVVAIRGIHASIKGRRERDKNYVTCQIGVISNGLLAVGMGIIFIGGFF